jgi:hypothetical protein
MKYITTPCSENRIFCDVQAGDRRAATAFEEIILYVDKEMKVYMKSWRDFKSVAMNGRRKEDSR